MSGEIGGDMTCKCQQDLADRDGKITDTDKQKKKKKSGLWDNLLEIGYSEEEAKEYLYFFRDWN